MNYILYSFISGLINALTLDGVFFITFGISLILITTFIILRIIKKDLKKNFICLLYYITVFPLAVLFSAVALTAEVPFNVFVFYISLLLTMDVLAIVPIILYKENKDKENEQITVKKEEKELIDFIDQEIEKQNVSKIDEPNIPLQKSNVKPIIDSVISVKEKDERKNGAVENEINFSHVESVIERLNCFDLSPTDRRQIENLKDEVSFVKKAGLTREGRAKINDGLSTLLKIMSKYGV